MQVDKGSPVNTEGHHQEKADLSLFFYPVSNVKLLEAWNSLCEYVCFKCYSLGIFSLAKQTVCFSKDFY